jgi:Tol biopolymer transport system component
MKIDTRTGLARGAPKQITNWAGFYIDNMTATADGRRLAFHRYSNRANVYVADLAPGGLRIMNPRLLTQTDGRNYPVGWSSDSRSLILTSNRNGSWEIFSQSLDSPSPVRIAAGLADSQAVQVSPDGDSVFYAASSAASGSPLRLMRVPARGGVPELFSTTALRKIFRCPKAPAKVCLLSEATAGGTELVFTELERMKSPGREVARISTEPGQDYLWDISPDGKTIAIVKHPTGSHGTTTDPIRILSVASQTAFQIQQNSWNTPESLNWTADGNALLVSTHVQGELALMRIELDGTTHVLWHPDGGPDEATVGIPSPDGHRIAILSWSENGNIWMIEGL